MTSLSSSAKPFERQVIVAGNWKMNKTRADAAELVKAIKAGLAQVKLAPEVVLIPPFTSLDVVGGLLAGTKLKLGAQNMDYRNSGAFTGEISPLMLKDLDVKYVLVGHSERRQFFGETNATAHSRINAAFANELLPILCVGETLDERESNLTDAVVSRQVAAALTHVENKYLGKVILAYEPVWAIGTGKHCEPAEANRVAKVIRQTLHSVFSQASAQSENAESVPILYGGSVTPANVEAILSQSSDQIDGILVGGASLKADDFLNLIIAGEKRLLNKQSAAVH